VVSYQIKRTKLETEKEIIIGVIISDPYISAIEKLLKNMQVIKSPYYRQLIKWCFTYYKKYNKSPQQHILDIFDTKKTELRNKEDIKNIEDVLQHLIDEYFKKLNNIEHYNTDFFFDRARKYIKRRNVELLIEHLQASINDGDVDEAENYIAKYKPIQKETGDGIDLLRDTDLIIDILTSDKDKLFKFPGAMGEAWKDLYRGDLIAIGAPQKRGKTWMLVYIATIALFCGLKVCYWTKEMKDKLMLKRIFQFFMGEIKTPYQEKETIVKIPYFDKQNNIKYKTNAKNGMEINNIVKVQSHVQRQSRTGQFKLYDFSTDGGTIMDIDRKLENLAYYDDFYADVVLVDYFDILDRVKGASRDKMEALNEIWLGGKNIAQRRNLLMGTASQLNRKTNIEEADVQHISDDIRKFGHVSHWGNLRRTEEEENRQVMRMLVKGRHDDFSNEDIVILQCLALGRPVVDCRWKSDIPNYQDWLDNPLEIDED